MSRTDVHRPWWVQLKDPYNRHLVYRHGPGEFDCYTFFQACGCPMCTGKYWRKHTNRLARIQWRAKAREILKTPQEDLEEVDGTLPSPHIAW